jgi:hypothetical protein
MYRIAASLFLLATAARAEFREIRQTIYGMD